MREFTFTVFAKTDTVSILRFIGPDGKAIGERELAASAIHAFVQQVESDYRVAAPRLAELGSRLYEWLDGPTERWLELARRGPGGLSLHVDVAERLRHLPWELLHAQGAFLALDPHRPFTPVRRALGDRREVSRTNRPLRVLFMACSPEGVAPVLDYEGEEGLILETTRRHPIELVVEESGSLDGLRERIVATDVGQYDVVHLTGHARIRGDGLPCFMMEDELGAPHESAADALARAFEGRWPRLIFFSACRTGQATDLGGLPSLCEAVVRAGAPAVLGWALPVVDLGASRAAAALYDQLAVGSRLDEAVARARLNLLEGNSPYWHLLRLYSDASELGELVTPVETPRRESVRIREAAQEFLDAGSKMEVCKRERFVGRRRPLQRCLRVLRNRQGDPGHAEGVLLHGMGGLGKSSLAARLCERLRGHARIILVGRIDEMALLGAVQAQGEGGEAARVLNDPDHTLRQRVRRLLEGPLLKRPALFVFDDFEHSLEASAGVARILRREALEVLDALLAGIRSTASASRVLVTSRYAFPLPGPARLYEEGVESMRGAEWAKKLAQLPAVRALEQSDAAVAERARALCAGNPRLAERVARVVGATAGASDVPALLAAMEREAAEFREEIFLRTLLDQQDAECLRVVAAISVYEVPVDLSAAKAAAGAVPIEKSLERAVAVGLVERGKEPGTEEPRFRVSGLLAPLLKGALNDDEWLAAQRRGARHLYDAVWKGRRGAPEGWAVEIHRLALAAGEAEIAREIAASLARSWVDADRYREAEGICTATLALGHDYRILHPRACAHDLLGHTPKAVSDYEAALRLCPAAATSEGNEVTRERAGILNNLARLVERQGNVRRALDLWQQALALVEQIADVEGKARTLGNVAGVIASQGDVRRALEIWQQALALLEQIGDVKGKASTLHNMAGVIAQQGDAKRALDLLQQALALQEQNGEVKGKAATLCSMAGVKAEQGDVRRALDLWQQALTLQEEIGHAEGKAATLGNMAQVIAQQGDVRRALDLWQEALDLLEQIGHTEGEATTLNGMASVIARQGDGNRALALWEQALALEEEIGDVRGKATTLNNMAGVIAQQGDAKRALALLQQALALQEQIGNAQGQAAALSQMGVIAFKAGEPDRARTLFADAAREASRGRAWPNLATFLSNLGACTPEQLGIFAAQAVWLHLHIEVAPESVVDHCAQLFRTLGQSHATAPLVAAFATWRATQAHEQHPQREQLLQAGLGMLVACAEARQIARDGFQAWVQSEGLSDPNRFLPALKVALEAMVPADAWLFDRDQVTK
ncbi:MAG: tetratricopeptide repeat protein [Planctomycetes bacterium]|nr:tetratricopeptide repeat protein [Planctomycetota bacterium]